MKHYLDNKVSSLIEDNTYSNLKNYFKGEKCVVFGCGPSLNDYEASFVKQKLHDHYFLCIKQAFYKYKDRCNIHFINDNNMIHYAYSDNQMIVTSCGNKRFPFQALLSKEPSFHFTIDDTNGYLGSITKTNNFHSNELKPSFESIWGPGIMIETVIPFIVHSGFSDVKMLGWDYTDQRRTVLPHYYSNNLRSKFKNPASPEPSYLMPDLIKSSDHLFNYFRMKNINVEILTDKSFVSSKFQRRILRG